MASIKVKRKNAETKQEKTFNSMKEAAEKSVVYILLEQLFKQEE